MDKEKAARTLAKKLGEKLGREEIIETSYKDNLVKNALAVYQLDSPISADFYDDKFCVKETKGESLTKLVQAKGSFADANYYFLESVHTLSQKYSNPVSRFLVTPYALIGDKESVALRKIFYKNVHPEIAYAMSTLGIDNFIDFYKSYKDLSFNSSFGYLTTPALTILKEDLEMVKKFIDFATKLEYDSDEEVDKKIFKQFDGIGSLNARLKRLGVTALIEPRVTSNHTPSDYVPRKVISQVIEQLLDLNPIKAIKKRDNSMLNEFGEFVFFSLPYEEQNIESNKRILKDSLDPDFVTVVLSKEYSNGKYFQEYFEVLDKEAQEKVVGSLKILTEKRPLHDSFLWAKGFKDLGLDYMNFYKENAGVFVEYFSQRSVDEKKAIIKDIMNCDFINEEAVNWLNKHEPDLVREVGLNG